MFEPGLIYVAMGAVGCNWEGNDAFASVMFKLPRVSYLKLGSGLKGVARPIEIFEQRVNTQNREIRVLRPHLSDSASDRPSSRRHKAPASDDHSDLTCAARVRLVRILFLGGRRAYRDNSTQNEEPRVSIPKKRGWRDRQASLIITGTRIRLLSRLPRYEPFEAGVYIHCGPGFHLLAPAMT